MGFCMHIEGVKCANCADGQPWQHTYPQPPLVPTGWLCPRCGTANNPNMPSCFGCRGTLLPATPPVDTTPTVTMTTTGHTCSMCQRGEDCGAGRVVG